MSKEEIDFLLDKIGKLSEYNFSEHALDRIKMQKYELSVISDEIDFSNVKNLLAEEYSIIEYHFKEINRLLIRTKKSLGRFDLCLVIIPEQKTILTAYLNRTEDNHRNLNKNIYSRKINIIELWNGAGGE